MANVRGNTTEPTSNYASLGISSSPTAEPAPENGNDGGAMHPSPVPKESESNQQSHESTIPADGEAQEASHEHSAELLTPTEAKDGSCGFEESIAPCPETPETDLRYQIILGSAQGIAYLHHDCLPPIVHRDIKANNILIGLNFEPYIADFGLAKLVEDREFGRCSNTVAGSYGYIAPEYVYSMKITEKSDVYSYGVVMLEVLTGKHPIDPTIPDGVHLVDWVRRRKGSSEVLDLVLRGRPDTEVEEMLQAIGVALLCVSPTPEERPMMKDVAAMLKEIRLEREEYAKVDVLLKGTSPLPATVGLNATTSGANSISGNKSNSSSFSGSTTVYSTSNAKSPFGYYLLTSPSQNVATDLNYVFLDSIDASFAHHKLRRSRSLNCQILPTLSSLVLEDT